MNSMIRYLPSCQDSIISVIPSETCQSMVEQPGGMFVVQIQVVPYGAMVDFQESSSLRDGKRQVAKKGV